MAYNQSDALFEPSTDTNANFGNSVSGQTNSFFLPKVYSKQVLNFFRKSSVVEAITNTKTALLSNRAPSRRLFAKNLDNDIQASSFYFR